TYADDSKNFSFTHSLNFPVLIVITRAGFQPHEFNLTSSGQEIFIPMKSTGQLNEVVVTGVNKVRSAFMDAPVSIEYISLRNIRNSPSPNYYENFSGKKGVDVTTSSLTF